MLHGGIKLKIAGMMTSNHNEWATPKDFFNKLNEEFHFTLDLSANKNNTKCSKFYSIEDNALIQYPKGETIFCNPPYGREIGKFVKKCSELSKDNTVVLLIPSRTDTSYWHNYIEGIAKVRFIRGRLKFEGLNGKGEFISGKPATFPSCVVIFNPTVN
jgi:phage N-6-adenine-methyltransferase